MPCDPRTLSRFAWDWAFWQQKLGMAPGNQAKRVAQREGWYAEHGARCPAEHTAATHTISPASLYPGPTGPGAQQSRVCPAGPLPQWNPFVLGAAPPPPSGLGASANYKIALFTEACTCSAPQR